MDSDDYGEDMDDTAFFDAATQAERDTSSPFRPSSRPVKRRRVNDSEGPRKRPFLDDSESDDFAAAIGRESSSDDHGHSAAVASARCTESAQKRKRRTSLADNHHSQEDGSPRRQTVAEQRKNRIHVPTADLDLSDAFFTQPPREPSPPWKPRGAIWHKPTLNIGINRPPRLNTATNPGLPIRNATVSSVKPATLPPGNTTTALPIGTGLSLEYDAKKELEDLPSDAFSSSPSSPVLVVSERRTKIVAPQTGLRQTTLFGRESFGEIAPSQVNKRYNYVVNRPEEPPTHHKLNPDALKTWVYPTNLGTIRDYQFNIVGTGLFHNTLVALPTGLGKTFIAAAIMLNWFRWTTEAQIVFVAPTKPLVAQQVDACFHIVGIPRSETTMLTGGVQTGLRAEEWAKRRVFFMTPQTLLNDLKSGYADPKKIVLLVVDEAHRATGSYAYVEVVSFLRRFNNSFRILALTATPGADVESIQKVIDGLDISKVEIRTENSIDLLGFVHQRKVEKHVFDNTDELEMCLELFEKAVDPVFKKVSGLRVLYSESARDLTPYGCMMGRQKWMKEQGQGANQGYKAMINSIFTVLGSIAQGLELLKYHGIGPFYVKLKEFKNEKTKSKYKKEIIDSDHFKMLMNRLEAWTRGENFVGHPKLEYLQQAVINHFVTSADSGPQGDAEANQTRIMVFTHFRDSAEDIVRVLKKHEPMIKPHVFVGQQNSKNSDGMDQKTQLAVIEKFKTGTYNTLVATSIGEEGLDIGEVDLIICYDTKASPIRMLQRMGRTGRKREGKIILLQMRGKEENDAIKAKDNYERMQKEIASGEKFAFHEARRILPRDVQPQVEKRPVEIPLENSQQNWLPEPNKKGRAPKKPPKKFHMPDNVITGFVTAGRMDEEIAPKSRKKKAFKPSEEVCEIPPLESVLLDDEATRDLERRYQTVYDDDDAPMVGALDLSKHSQRVLGKALLLSPGRVTKSFVAMMQRMHDMTDNRLNEWRRILQYTDIEDLYEGVVVSENEQVEQIIQDEDDMWADDDPASQPLPKPKSKPGPKARTESKAAPAPFIEDDTIWADDDPPSQPLSKAKSKPKLKAKAAPKAAAPRGRPRKETSATTPIRKTMSPPKTKTPNWRMSNSAEEGASSSPPPTDPQMRFGSQAETIGSDDTIDADNNPQDTQAYRLDSDLVSFIAEDEDEIEQLESSSLPGINFSNGVGHGTQALVKAAKPKRAKKAAKIFSSDTSDNDAVVSSDDNDEDDGPVERASTKESKSMAFVVDSESELETETEVKAAVVPKMKRARRVVEDDEDDE